MFWVQLFYQIFDINIKYLILFSSSNGYLLFPLQCILRAEILNFEKSNLFIFSYIELAFGAKLNESLANKIKKKILSCLLDIYSFRLSI